MAGEHGKHHFAVGILMTLPVTVILSGSGA